MKLSTKSLSSPGRAEKLYPPPLMRFLRSNGGSRSRRSRSSPMFVRKKNAPNIETQEPSSPKVTCMGQVRVSRSKQSKTRPGKHKTRCSSWVHCNPLFCRCRWRKKKHRKVKCFTPSSNVWRRWVMFFRCGFKRKSKGREDPVKVEPEFGDYSRSQEMNKESEEVEDDDEEEPEDEDAKVYVSITPPKNALLLTRCRSAPYRSSSLACKFWSEETEEKQSSTDQESREEDEENEGESVSASDSCTKESRLDQENEEEKEKIEFLKEIGESIISIEKRLSLKAGNVEELSKEEDGIGRPLMLTRCKSEPARTGGEKLYPEIGFGKKGRRCGLWRKDPIFTWWSGIPMWVVKLSSNLLAIKAVKRLFCRCRI